MKRLLKQAVNNKIDRNTFKQTVLNNGYIQLDSDGKYFYIVTEINDQNFNDISPKLKEQLENEGKYGSYIGFVDSKNTPLYSVQMLPIYGNSQSYVTKWFTDTAEEAIDNDLRSRQMALLKRANEYIINNSEN
jgi:hypothetical protein